MALIAILLAILAGFAAQRGSICAVAAVADLVARRRPQRYLAFLECAAWSLALLSLFTALGVQPASIPSDYAAGVGAALGGALFGVGAAINGACTFGTAARLGRGEIAFAAMPVGFIAGVAAASRLFAAPIAAPANMGDGAPSIIVMALVFFVGFQLFRMTDSVRGPHDAVKRLSAPIWHPSLAMAAIGLSSALLMIFFAPWPYSNLLVDIGAHASSERIALKIALAVAFVAGASIGAHTRGAVRIERPALRDLLEKATGGAMMGAGSYLVPGGNDSLVLVGLPHLFAYAIIAYLSMTLAIAVLLLAQRRMAKRLPRPS